MSGVGGWTIYIRPKDFPDKYVARRWVANGGRVWPTDDILLADDPEDLRAAMAQKGLTRFGRVPSDDPVIMEVWL